MEIEQLKQMNLKIIEEFRANKGVVGGPFAGVPMLLLTTRGRRSGRRRITPLVYGEDGPDLFVIASKAGSSTHPHWYLNLKTNPNVTVEVGIETFPARAMIAQEPERTRLFAQQVRVMPQFKVYQDKTARVIPVVRLERS